MVVFDFSLVGTGGLLRFGHARGLTPHRGVIQGPRAASLPRLSVREKIDTQKTNNKPRQIFTVCRGYCINIIPL